MSCVPPVPVVTVACISAERPRSVLRRAAPFAKPLSAMLRRTRSPDGPWGMFVPELQAELEDRARQCADLFQRSSSCVEGRNGQLSLRHHALHHLTARKLQALTVLHNYAVPRTAGSTAAGRFYGNEPQNLLAWLLRRLPLPKSVTTPSDCNAGTASSWQGYDQGPVGTETTP